MITQTLSTLKINKLTPAQYKTQKSAGNIKENEIYLTGMETQDPADFKPIISQYTMTSASWNTSAKTYSFESLYPNSTYIVEIEPDKTCTDAQLDAWAAARMVGDYNSSIVTARGEVPTVDIPVILKVIRK